LGLKRRPPTEAASLEAATREALEEIEALPTDGVVDALNRRNMNSRDHVASVLSLADRTPIAADRVSAITAARERFARALPPSLVALWRHESRRERFVRGFLRRKVIVPEQLLSPPGWAADARLTAVSPRLGSAGYSDIREIFSNEYVEWFAATEPKLQLSKLGDLRGAEAGALFRIDPALAEWHIALAGWHNESHFVVAALRDDRNEAPVFSHHDDDEGLCELVGRTCVEWFEREIEFSLGHLRERI